MVIFFARYFEICSSTNRENIVEFLDAHFSELVHNWQNTETDLENIFHNKNIIRYLTNAQII